MHYAMNYEFSCVSFLFYTFLFPAQVHLDFVCPRIFFRPLHALLDFSSKVEADLHVRV